MLRTAAATTLVACLASSSSAQPTYNETTALEYAYLATAAYCGYPKTTQASLEAWSCGPACSEVPGVTQVKQILTNSGDDAYAYVAKVRGQCVVAFRGTSDLAGWLEDLSSLDLVPLSNYGVPCTSSGNTCNVGKGFVSNYFSVAAFVQGNLTAIGCPPGETLALTGHSLGAAEATIAAFDLQARGYGIKEIYTFGQPRVGDAAFAEAFDAGVQLSKIYRISYHKDPVVHLPFEFNGFQHIGREIFYDGLVSQGARICDGAGEDPSCANKYWDVPGMTLACVTNVNSCDHLLYMTAAKTILMDGTSCVDGTAEPAFVA